MCRTLTCFLLGCVALAAGRAAAADEPAAGPVQAGKSLDEWLDLLAAPDAGKRGQAAEAIRSLARGGRAGLPRLARLLRHENTEVRLAALQVLPAYGSASLPVVRPLLWDEDPVLRLGAILVLEQLRAEARPAVPSLAARLGDPEAVIRSRAAELLGDLGERSAVPALRKLLADDIPAVRGNAAFALVKLEAEDKQVVAVLAGLLRDQEEPVRVTAAQLLGRLGQGARDALPDLLRAAAAPGAPRAEAVRALGKIGADEKKVVAALRGLLGEDDPAVRLAAAEGLWRLTRRPDVAAALKQVLEGDDIPHAVGAARLLWHIRRDPRALTALARALARGKEREQQLALLVLGNIGPGAGAALPAVLPLLKASSSDVRGQALHFLVRLGEPARESVPAVKKLVGDSDPLVRVHALHALWSIERDTAALEALAGLGEDQDREVREGTLFLVGRIGPEAKKTVPALARALDDPRPAVRLAAAEALWKVGHDPRALPALRKLLEDDDPGIRGLAAVSLGASLGAEAASAVPGLARLLWDQDSHVRANAAEALGRIGPGAGKAVPALTVLLDTEGLEDHVHSSAAEALGLMGTASREAVPVLQRRLTHPSSYVRALAARSLWQIARDPDAAAALEKELASRSAPARITAAEGLWLARRDPRSVPLLLGVLGEHLDVSIIPTGDNRALLANQKYMAARALGRIGPPAREAVAALRALLDDEDPDLRRTAARALAKIAP